MSSFYLILKYCYVENSMFVTRYSYFCSQLAFAHLPCYWGNPIC